MSKNNEAQVYRVKDSLWERLKQLIPPPQGRGRRPVSEKGCFEGIIFILRTGSQWKDLPKEYPPKSTVHDCFQKWRRQEVFSDLWKNILEEYDEVEGINWEWLSGDSSSVKAPLGGEKNR